MKNFTPLIRLKIFTAVLMLPLGAFSQGQGQGQNLWKTNGNQTSETDFIGTVNEKDVVLKSFNQERLRLKANGDLHLKEFTNNEGYEGKGLMYHDIEGRLRKVPFTGVASEIFNGHGVFSNIREVAGFEKTGNKILSFPNANIGVNNPDPVEALDVIGSGIFSGKLTANEFNVKDRLTFGTRQALRLREGDGMGGPDTWVFGVDYGVEVIPPDPCTNAPNLNTISQFKGTVQAYGYYNWDPAKSLNVISMGFDGHNGYINTAGTTPEGGPELLLNWHCGRDVIVGNPSSGNLIANKDLIVGGNTILNKDLQVKGALKNNQLQIGEDDKSLKLFYDGAKGRLEQTGGHLLINYNSKEGIETWGDLIVRENLSTSKNVFLSMASGFVGIGTNTLSSNETDVKLKVQGKAKFVNGSGGVEIYYNTANGHINQTGNGGLLLNWGSGKDVSAWGNFSVFKKISETSSEQIFKVNVNDEVTYVKKLNVTLDGFDDYVFADNYALPTLLERRLFINTNKHLPYIPSEKEIIEKGADFGVVIRGIVRNTEEISLYQLNMNDYLVKLMADFKDLAERNKDLEQRIKELEEK